MTATDVDRTRLSDDGYLLAVLRIALEERERIAEYAETFVVDARQNRDRCAAAIAVLEAQAASDAAAAEPALDRPETPPTPSPQRRPRRNAADFERVASIARSAFDVGESMADAVAANLTVSKGTARTLISRARKAGHDIPTQLGYNGAARGAPGQLQVGTDPLPTTTDPTPEPPTDDERPELVHAQWSEPDPDTAPSTGATDTKIDPRARFECQEPGCENRSFGLRTELIAHTLNRHERNPTSEERRPITDEEGD